ncbi:MAG: phosphoserine transaminase [Maricaulaceae bacterium]
MAIVTKPDLRPENPRFSSGPTAKRPGWKVENLNLDVLGRSHRSALGKERLKYAIDLTREVLGVPDDYRIGIVPASDTGAVEMAMWSLLGPRGVDVAAWESFGNGWITDAQKQLPLDDVRVLTGDYGRLPDLEQYTGDRDLVFTWNGTTSGVKLPNADFIPADRDGITICDATSAAFAQDIEWNKVDVLTFSWQKVMGGEAAHGMLIMSPRAVERLESYNPPWPMPKIFRLKKGDKINEGIFKGATINTPSMLATEDYIDALEWAKSIGGKDALLKRADENAQVLFDWIERTPWIENLAQKRETWSNTGVCMVFNDERIKDGAAFAKAFVALLGDEGVALDFGAYRDAPAGLRIWAGSAIDKSNITALTPWLDWAFETLIAQQ